VYTIVHEHFEEIFHPKAPKYGRSLFVLNSYIFFEYGNDNASYLNSKQRSSELL